MSWINSWLIFVVICAQIPKCLPNTETGGTANGSLAIPELPDNYTDNRDRAGKEYALNDSDQSGKKTAAHKEHEECKLTVASFDWAHVQNPLVIAAFLFLTAVIKIGFHHSGYLVTKIPESCLLIVLGTIVGTIFTFATDPELQNELRTLDPGLFFLVLLPPIVLEASYSLHNRVFFDNLGSILVFAVIGTIITCFFIGPVLYLLSWGGALPGGPKISFIHCLLFASVLVAVDPVAVLAIFQEVGVNTVLYFLVFGESLLNDAVTVVLYHTVEGMSCFLEEGTEIDALKYVTAFFKFFASSFGGILIGVIFGAITALLTKHTVETRVVEPLVLFSLAYLSYVTSELFHFSGIIGITVCGLVQAQYAFHNISHKSYVTVKYFTMMASTASDSVIFLFLGLNIVRLDHVWHPGFIVASVLLALIGRFMITYGLCAIVNLKRLRTISKREQFIMAYGGLRGAVAFSLVSLLHNKLDQNIQSMFMTTILINIIFTVFIQGGTIKPLVSLLDIATKEEEEVLLFNELNGNVTDHVMAGIEEIVGLHGDFFIFDWLHRLDGKYIKCILQRNPLTKDEKIMKIYEKIALKQHFANLKGAAIAEDFMAHTSIQEEEEETQMGSLPSLHPVFSDVRRRGMRTSLLSQLTRFGTVDEPGQIDDIAYITPEMLEDEEMTAVQQKRLSRQQSFVNEESKDPHNLRLLLNKPGSSMDARELRANVDMDERSNLMYLLQEKNKRLERFKKSFSHLNTETGSAHFEPVPSMMAPIPERASGQIVRKSIYGRQGSYIGRRPSAAESRIKSRKGVYIIPGVPATNDSRSVTPSGILPNIGVSKMSNKMATDVEKQKRRTNVRTVKSLPNDEETGLMSVSGSNLAAPPPAKPDESSDRNNSNLQDATDSGPNAGGSVSQGSEDIEMTAYDPSRRNTLDLVLENMQADGDLEKAASDTPLAQSSPDTVGFLPTLVEHPESSSRLSDLALARQGAASDPPSQEGENTEKEKLIREQGL